ncbi:MAG: glutamate-ammonia-ligase adenylyltransferase, partial [Chloroflexota bacterium]|nr:glutamate-ammonia-ligase adenylyltransferase [Chloroflexota bacterium]
DQYFQRFDDPIVAEHVRGLAHLSASQPAEVQVAVQRDGLVNVTVLAFDYPSAFSLIAGVLTSAGFSILSGEVFTYGPARHAPTSPAAGRGPRRRVSPELARRRIVDSFSGLVDGLSTVDRTRTEVTERIRSVFALLESGGPTGSERAKHQVNEWVTKRIANLTATAAPPFPVQIDIEPKTETGARVRVVSQDTPAFLYSLSTALALHNLTIERVRIRTTAGKVEDELDVAASSGQPISSQATLDQIKLSVALTKQFTYSLDRAPDPYAALTRFEQLADRLSTQKGSREWLELLSNPLAMQDLARILGASDFLWEDFIRSQYEALLPVLRARLEGRQVSASIDEQPDTLLGLLAAAPGFAEQRRALNQYKDRQALLIDVEHILGEGLDVDRLGRRLTTLAEHVLRAASETIYTELASRHGEPFRETDELTPWTLLGLGKLGSASLGYASDLELLLVYRDAGETRGRQRLSNAEFFAQMVRDLTQFIVAKHEGLFELDLKLRPYGIDGPLACQLASFAQYYGPGGPAHSLERLALTRLRPIAGDAALGREAERLRDHFVYDVPCLNLEELRQTRLLQFEQKQERGKYNAKYGPGALLDVEYAVQILQVMYGKSSPRLRTPLIMDAMAGLQELGILGPHEYAQLSAAYQFLRRLTNGLRMLRGSSADLFLPETESDEFLHLARRMGYRRLDSLEPAQQLDVQFEARTASVRAFIQRRFGRAALPGPEMGTIADVVLSDQVPRERREQLLRTAGLNDVRRAFTNLRLLAVEDPDQDRFAQLAVLALAALRGCPDADRALELWRQLADRLEEPEAHFAKLIAQPDLLDRLLQALSTAASLDDLQRSQPALLSEAGLRRS